MARTIEVEHTTTREHVGKVIGHLVRYFPEKDKGWRTGVLKQKLGACVQFEIDGKKTQIVYARNEAGTLLGPKQEPTPELGIEIYGRLHEKYPIHQVRKIVEHTRRKNGAIKNRWFEILSPQD